MVQNFVSQLNMFMVTAVDEHGNFELIKLMLGGTFLVEENGKLFTDSF